MSCKRGSDLSSSRLIDETQSQAANAAACDIERCLASVYTPFQKRHFVITVFNHLFYNIKIFQSRYNKKLYFFNLYFSYDVVNINRNIKIFNQIDVCKIWWLALWLELAGISECHVILSWWSANCFWCCIILLVFHQISIVPLIDSLNYGI